MKNIYTLLSTLVSVCTLITCLHLPAQPIILETKLLNLIDGTFINADRIEEIKRFKFKLLNLLLGEMQPNGTRIGLYQFQGKPHSIQMLQEKELSCHKSEKKLLNELLNTAIRDFLQISDEFRDSARGSKTFMVLLIEKSCEKRGRMDSTLLTWANATLEQEHAVFKKEITSFDKLDSFLIDLFNFLMDLEHSCPRACSLFNERVTKYTIVKKILTEYSGQYLMGDKVGNKISDKIDEKEFFADLLQRKTLDTLSPDMITPEKVRDLMHAFIKTKNSPSHE